MKPFLSAPSSKPLLRGHFHQEAFFAFLGACIVLTASSGDQLKFFANLIYSLSLLFLFGVSAVYHRPHWNPGPRALLKRLDHSAIFIVIAGSFTPFCLLTLPDAEGTHLLLYVWGAAAFGILQSIFWVKAPKWLKTLLYVGVAFLVLPYLSQLGGKLRTLNMQVIFLGDAVYGLGAVFYALKRPTLNPKVFGYHELFHICTILGAALHFFVIYQITR